MNHHDVITTGPDGRARVRGLQILVRDVLRRFAQEPSEAAVIAEFPGLTPSDIRACRVFANSLITRVRDITAENPSVEVWKYLRFFLDGTATAELIRHIHCIPESAQAKNVLKQSQQIGFCIRQAEQYFTASTQVGLPTRPVLLYYGAVSLSQAVILLKNDGTFSLDARRKDRRHNHHGLDLSRGLVEDAARSDGPQGFLEKIECRVHLHSGHPWGHFPLFYESLAPQAAAIHARVHVEGKGSFLERDYPVNSVDSPPLSSICNRALNAWGLFKDLPDLCSSLAELGMPSNLCPGSVKRLLHTSPNRVRLQDSFFVDGITPAQKQTFLEFYRRKNHGINVLDDHGSNLHMSVTAEGGDENDAFDQLGYYPDIVEDLARKKHYIIEPEKFTPESAAILALLFCFSMLCRYYPEVWMKSIDKRVRLAELANVFLNIAYRKFPGLMLDQLTGTKHIIHP